MEYTLALTDVADDEVRKLIVAPLVEYNESKAGPSHNRPLAVVLRDKDRGCSAFSTTMSQWSEWRTWSRTFSPQVSGILGCSWSLRPFMAAVRRKFCTGISNPGCRGTARSGCASASSKETCARSAFGRIQAIWIFESVRAWKWENARTRFVSWPNH